MSQHCLLCWAWTACLKPGQVTPNWFKNSNLANSLLLLMKTKTKTYANEYIKGTDPLLLMCITVKLLTVYDQRDVYNCKAAYSL